MRLGERAYFLRPFTRIWSRVSGLMQFREGSEKKTQLQVLCKSRKMRQGGHGN
jgi:hypothetical protein